MPQFYLLVSLCTNGSFDLGIEVEALVVAASMSGRGRLSCSSFLRLHGNFNILSSILLSFEMRSELFGVSSSGVKSLVSERTYMEIGRSAIFHLSTVIIKARVVLCTNCLIGNVANFC